MIINEPSLITITSLGWIGAASRDKDLVFNQNVSNYLNAYFLHL